MKANFACGSYGTYFLLLHKNLLCEQIFVKKIVLFHPAGGNIHC